MTLVARDPQAVEQLPPLTLDDIRKYICPDANEAEAFMFLRLCQSQGLNPFVRDAYLVVFGQGQNRKVSMIVGKDTFTKRADAQPELEYWKAGVIVLRGDAVLELEGTFYLKTDELVGGWAEVKRSDRSQPYKVTVRLSEYSQTYGQWPKMPGTMIRKVALVQGLRESFPNPFRGLYDAAEMGLDPETLPQSTITVTSVAEPVPPPVERPALEAPQRGRSAPSGWPVEETDTPRGNISPAQINALWPSARTALWTQDDVHAYIKRKYDAGSVKELTYDQATELIEFIKGGGSPNIEPAAALEGQPALI